MWSMFTTIPKSRKTHLVVSLAHKVVLVIFLSKVFAPQLRRNWSDRLVRSLLELGRLHGDGNTDEEDAEEGDSGVSTPVLRATVRPTSHAPNLGPPISSIHVTVLTTSHFSLIRSEIMRLR
uniref:Uncharacterized protein n=1 Tax=Opuntia streptacantha TaxID=393608 RepID=A0A7C8YV58_OPUST